MNRKILVIGGAGYIGSHMARQLSEEGREVTVLDNFSTGHRWAVPKDAEIIAGDLRDPDLVEKLLGERHFSTVLHFAASSLVSESIAKPHLYYENNAGAFLNLLRALSAHPGPRLVLSSTAAVYGDGRECPLTEASPLSPINPYGRSKAMMEEMLRDVAGPAGFSYVIFRYFNAAGAHEAGDLGEDHDPETHLIPNLLQAVFENGAPLTVHGADYPTPDGTCIRDYVHVQDLCDAHRLAVDYLESGGPSEIFNLGTGCGYSIQEVIRTAGFILGRPVPVVTGPARPGDPPVLVADGSKAKTALGWKPKRSLKAILETAAKWHQYHAETLSSAV